MDDQVIGYVDLFNDVVYRGPNAKAQAERALEGGNPVMPLFKKNVIYPMEGVEHEILILDGRARRIETAFRKIEDGE